MDAVLKLALVRDIVALPVAPSAAADLAARSSEENVTH
jgi:hypothetical protein